MIQRRPQRIDAGLQERAKAFTLIELLVGMATFLVMLGFMGSILNSVYSAWETARRETEIAQNARAILSLIERDLTPALVSNLMQFGQNPDLASKLVNETQVANSDSLFFWAPVASSSDSTLSQVGWYLTRPATPTAGCLYNLKRFSRKAVAIDIASNNAGRIYWLQDSPNAPLDLTADSSVVSERVLGFWIECIDRNGRPIPALLASESSAVPLRYNSAARFQMAPAGEEYEDNTTFHYTAPTTMQANLLPAAVRVTILLTDEATLLRHSSSITPIPPLPTPAANNPPEPIDRIVTDYISGLRRENIHASSFSTVVKLTNAQNL